MIVESSKSQQTSWWRWCRLCRRLEGSLDIDPWRDGDEGASQMTQPEMLAQLTERHGATRPSGFGAGGSANADAPSSDPGHV